MNEKEVKLYNAITHFSQLVNPTAEEYLTFMMRIAEVTRQGSGLMWSNVFKMLKEILEER